MKFRFNREIEISVSLIASFLGYVFLALWFTARLSAGQDAMQAKIEDLTKSVQALTLRLDAHIDKGK